MGTVRAFRYVAGSAARLRGKGAARRSVVPRPILVVDDEPPIADLVAEVLADEGHDVRRAPDGLAALDAVEQAEPPLIVSDLAMPRLDGRGLVARLAEPRHRVPVVIMSAQRPTAPLPDGIASLPKPFGIDDLVATVDGALARADP